MPRKQSAIEIDPGIELKTLALRDDPLVHDYRDLHYQLVIDQLHATEQLVTSGEPSRPLSCTRRETILKRHARLHKRICRKYSIGEFRGGDPSRVKRLNWLETLYIPSPQPLKIETSWRSSFYSPEVVFFVPPKDAKAFPTANNETVYQLPSLPERPTGLPPVMTVRVDLSKVKRNREANIVETFRRALQQCVAELSQRHTKPRSSWKQNIQRDYSRFRLHQQGMPFRWIAYKERTGEVPSGAVTGPVPIESSIRDSVKRVHLILFSREYSIQRDKAALRNAPLKQACDSFNCPLHGRDDCPLTCQHAQNLMTQIEPLLS